LKENLKAERIRRQLLQNLQEQHRLQDAQSTSRPQDLITEIEREKPKRAEAEAAKEALELELNKTKEHNRLLEEESRHMREQVTRMIEEHRYMWEAIRRIEAEGGS
jgi:hypothetical protein